MKYILLFLISFAINQATYADVKHDTVIKKPIKKRTTWPHQYTGKLVSGSEILQDLGILDEGQLPKKGKMGLIRSLSFPNPFMAIENGNIANVAEYIGRGGLDYDHYGHFRTLHTYPLLAAVIAQDIKIIQLLAEAEARYEDKSNLTHALSYLFQIILARADTKTKMKKIEQIAKILIDSGAEVNHETRSSMKIGRIPMMNSANSLEINKSWTPLHFVIAYSDNANLVKMLIEAGADLNIEMRRTGTPLEYAREKNRTEIIKVLKRAKSIKKKCANAF